VGSWTIYEDTKTQALCSSMGIGSTHGDMVLPISNGDFGLESPVLPGADCLASPNNYPAGSILARWRDSSESSSPAPSLKSSCSQHEHTVLVLAWPAATTSLYQAFYGLAITLLPRTSAPDRRCRLSKTAIGDI